MATASLYSAKVSGGLPRRSLPLLRFFFLGRFSFLRATPYLPDRGERQRPLSGLILIRPPLSTRERFGEVSAEIAVAARLLLAAPRSLWYTYAPSPLAQEKR